MTGDGHRRNVPYLWTALPLSESYESGGFASERNDMLGDLSDNSQNGTKHDQARLNHRHQSFRTTGVAVVRVGAGSSRTTHGSWSASSFRAWRYARPRPGWCWRSSIPLASSWPSWSLRGSKASGRRLPRSGRVLWIVSLLLAGYYFGNIALVKENFTIVLLAIVFLSVLPGRIEYLRQRRAPGR